MKRYRNLTMYSTDILLNCSTYPQFLITPRIRVKLFCMDSHVTDNDSIPSLHNSFFSEPFVNTFCSLVHAYLVINNKHYGRSFLCGFPMIIEDFASYCEINVKAKKYSNTDGSISNFPNKILLIENVIYISKTSYYC